MVTPAQLIRRKKALRKYVVKHGGNPKGLNNAPIAGPVYRKWIRWLQRREWPNLPDTGIADTRVLAVLFPPAPESIGLKALEIAKLRLGAKEDPPESNRGPVVDIFLAACGFRFKRGQKGQPWCACFVTWALRQAGWKQSGWNQAFVPSWVATAHLAQHGLRTIGSSEVQAGDIVCFDWPPRNGIPDHIGFVTSTVTNGIFRTLEGNTSAGSDSNGGQVQARERRLADAACFIRVVG